MPDLDKVLKGLQIHGDYGGSCSPCPYDCEDRECCVEMLCNEAAELLKQYSGLASALEQSNAVNEHLNAEIERLKEMQRVDNCERCRFKDKCLTGRQLSR